MLMHLPFLHGFETRAWSDYQFPMNTPKFPPYLVSLSLPPCVLGLKEIGFAACVLPKNTCLAALKMMSHASPASSPSTSLPTHSPGHNARLQEEDDFASSTNCNSYLASDASEVRLNKTEHCPRSLASELGSTLGLHRR